MPGPDPHALWIEEGAARPTVTYEPYFWTGNGGNRKTRAIAILRRLARGTWRCRWCGETLPDYLRADALYCNERCRKRVARWRRRCRDC